MNARSSVRHAVAGLLALCSAAASAAPVRAAFTLSINDTVVATDGGAGDADSRAGVLSYSGTVRGYAIEFTALTTGSSPTLADITTTQLLVKNVSGHTPLTITVSESAFGAPAGAPGVSDLSSSFTRLKAAGLGASGVVSMTSTAESAAGGGSASTDPITFSKPLGADSAEAAFDRTSDLYSLSTTVKVRALKAGDAMVLTVDSAVAGGTFLAGPALAAPAPPGLALVLSAVPLLPLARRRARR